MIKRYRQDCHSAEPMHVVEKHFCDLSQIHAIRTRTCKVPRLQLSTCCLRTRDVCGQALHISECSTPTKLETQRNTHVNTEGLDLRLPKSMRACQLYCSCFGVCFRLVLSSMVVKPIPGHGNTDTCSLHKRICALALSA